MILMLDLHTLLLANEMILEGGHVVTLIMTTSEGTDLMVHLAAAPIGTSVRAMVITMATTVEEVMMIIVQGVIVDLEAPDMMTITPITGRVVPQGTMETGRTGGIASATPTMTLGIDIAIMSGAGLSTTTEIE